MLLRRPTLLGEAHEDAYGWTTQGGRRVCACWSPLSAPTPPAAPPARSPHGLTEGDAGGGRHIPTGSLPREDAPTGGRGGLRGEGAARRWARGCRLASTLLLILQGGDLWTTESSRLGEGGGEGRVQAGMRLPNCLGWVTSAWGQPCAGLRGMHHTGAAASPPAAKPMYQEALFISPIRSHPPRFGLSQAKGSDPRSPCAG